ncbi:MAG: glycosyltransferase family 2 protein [Bacteroidetes bacterium]|nr:glycosyltransferase family 2 protein [Bacteroidota bacterium]
MLFWKIVFYICIFIVLYNYLLYGLIVFVLNKAFPQLKLKYSNEYSPTVSFIVAAYNEGTIIEKKIENSLQQDYPSSAIEYIFITDGSTDSTPEIVSQYPQIRLLHDKERAGKSAALNRAVANANNEILIISDANTLLNQHAIRNITRHYYNDVVGGVAGEKRVMESLNDTENVGGREGLYWKYESFLKKLDSDFYSVVGAAGELFSVRKQLYEYLPASTILDDFVISLKVAGRGFRVIYEPEAYAVEFASTTLEDEKKRKVRIAAGGFQSILMLLPLLKFWKHQRLTFLYLSHRVLRWTLSPLALILIFISNLIILLIDNQLFYLIAFSLQILFYFTAFLSNFIPSDSKMKPLKFAGYFVFMNVSVIQGFFRFISGRQSAVWEKVNRSSGN